MCLLEASIVAIYHAAPSNLQVIDDLQLRFLRALNLPEEAAFLEFNLAPLQLRRDIAVLGLLHKIQLGEAHQDFELLFPKMVGSHVGNTRRNARRHGKQFWEQDGNTDYFNRSVFGALRVYNLLPEYVVNSNCVQQFQTLLTKDARFQCRHGNPAWARIYTTGLR